VERHPLGPRWSVPVSIVTEVFELDRTGSAWTPTLFGASLRTTVSTLQNGSTDAFLWPIPMDYFRYVSPGAFCRSVPAPGCHPRVDLRSALQSRLSW